MPAKGFTQTDLAIIHFCSIFCLAFISWRSAVGYLACWQASPYCTCLTASFVWPNVDLAAICLSLAFVGTIGHFTCPSSLVGGLQILVFSFHNRPRISPPPVLVSALSWLWGELLAAQECWEYFFSSTVSVSDHLCLLQPPIRDTYESIVISSQESSNLPTIHLLQVVHLPSAFFVFGSIIRVCKITSCVSSPCNVCICLKYAGKEILLLPACSLIVFILVEIEHMRCCVVVVITQPGFCIALIF